jgi:hypothetical protein
MVSATAEAGTDPVVDTEGLVPSRSGVPAPLDRWLEADPDSVVARVESRVRALEVLRVASIKASYPSDWLIHTSLDPEGNVIRQVGYLQDVGAERAGKIWGIEIGQPAIEREEFPDGTFAYHMVAEAWSKVTGERLDYVEGSRWSGDPFFAKQVKNEGDRVDPIDVRKAAYANLHGRAVRALSGLNGVPLDVLRQAGLDIGKVVHVNYGKGTSSTGVGGSEPTIRWGNCKGQKVSELSDKDLAYYVGAEEKSLADPAKEKYRKSTQAMLDALRGEQDRRKKSAEQAEETGTAAPAGGATRGQKLIALKKRLDTALGKGNGQLLGDLLRALGANADSLSDLGDEDLDKLAGVPDDEISALAEAAKRSAS